MNPFHQAAEYLHRLAGPTAPDWLQGTAIMCGIYVVLIALFALAALLATLASMGKS